MLKWLFGICDFLYVCGFVAIVAGAFGDHNLIPIGVVITLVAIIINVVKILLPENYRVSSK